MLEYHFVAYHSDEEIVDSKYKGGEIATEEGNVTDLTIETLSELIARQDIVGLCEALKINISYLINPVLDKVSFDDDGMLMLLAKADGEIE
jgi:hypothetical protein